MTASGLTTSLMPHPTGPAFQIDFDFLAHRLEIATVDGAARSLPLEDRPVAEFYEAVMSMLDDLGLTTSIWPMPVEIPDAIPFVDDRVHARYDRDAVQRFWLALVDDAAGVQRVPEPLRRQGQSRCTSSGAPSTSPTPASRDARRPRIRAEPRTAGRT